MSDLQVYVTKRRVREAGFDDGFEKGYRALRIGELLRQMREESGLTQADMAAQLHTQTSAISRIENHAEDIRLSTLEKFAAALGRTLEVSIR